MIASPSLSAACHTPSRRNVVASVLRSAAEWLERHRFLVAATLFVAVVALYADPAQAYMGEEFLNNVSSRILAPIALFVILGAIVAWWAMPQHASRILYTVLAIVVFFAVLKGGTTVIAWMQNTSLDH